MLTRPRSAALPSSDWRERGEVLGKDGDDVDPHHAQSSSRPSGGSTTTKPAVEVDGRHDRRDERDQQLVAVRTADDEQVLGLVPDRGDLAEHRAVGSRASSPTSWWS